MLRLLHLLPVACLLFGFACFISAVTLWRTDLSWLAPFLGQAGTANPKILEKIQQIPAVLAVTGVEAMGVGLLCLFQRRRLRDYLSCVEARLTARQSAAAMWVGGSLVIALLAVNFGWVNLTQRVIRYGFNRESQMAANWGEWYGLIKALRERTPEDACIAIRTRDPIKFLLNYELFPRRFFVYPNPDMSLSKLPGEWLQKYSIRWTLEVQDNLPSEFVLRRLDTTE